MPAFIRLGVAALSVPLFLVLGVAVAAGATSTAAPSPFPASSGCGTVTVQAGEPADGTVLDGFPIRMATYGQAASPPGDRVVVGFTRPV
jgi:hypothetical protein